MAQKGYSFDADRFFDNYNSTGWKKHGDSITDWRSLCDYWQNTEQDKPRGKQKPSDEFQQHGQPLSPMMREAIRQAIEEDDE